jgi:hypothetical protein
MEDNITPLVRTPSVTNGPHMSYSHSFSFFFLNLIFFLGLPDEHRAGRMRVGSATSRVRALPPAAHELRRRPRAGGLHRPRACFATCHARALSPAAGWRAPLAVRVLCHGSRLRPLSRALDARRGETKGNEREMTEHEPERSGSVPRILRDGANPHIGSIISREPLHSLRSPSKQPRERVL